MATMKDVYRLFTSKVAAGRKLDMEKLATLAEGRVFTGRMALEAGLVDRLGTLDDAVDEARTLAGIAEDEPLERLLLPEPRGLFDDLFAMTGQDGSPTAQLVGHETLLRALILARQAGIPGLESLTAHVGALAELASGQPLMLMPVRVRIR